MPDIEAIQKLTGAVLGTSSWLLVDQQLINRFADLTNDHMFIHVDPERAKATPFGGTIAHGLLTLSLLPAFAADTIPQPDGMKWAANYGYDKIRFTSPVSSGRNIRACFTQLEFKQTKPGLWRQVVSVTVEIENEAKPALTAEWIMVYMV